MTRGAFYCEPAGGEPFWWPYCEIGGCPNGVCFGRSDRFCWPHGPGSKTLSEIIAENSAPEMPQKRDEPA